MKNERGKERNASKTQRAAGVIGLKSNAILEVQKLTGQKDKSTSARSNNNIEVWLSKKKAFDQQSK